MEDLFEPKIDEGGGEGDSGDFDSYDIEFDDSEAEVFEATEIDFGDDTDIEVIEAQPLLDEINNAKASCKASSREAKHNAEIMGG
jgi:hypothetical protein